MNGAGLTTGSVAGLGAGGGGRIMVAEASIHNKLVEVWGFVECDRGGPGWMDPRRGCGSLL